LNIQTSEGQELYQIKGFEQVEIMGFLSVIVSSWIRYKFLDQQSHHLHISVEHHLLTYTSNVKNVPWTCATRMLMWKFNDSHVIGRA
jgi:hypothetical protein